MTTELVVTVNGDLSVDSNIEEFKEYVLAEIKKADRKLETDDDFAEADKLVKRFEETGKALRARKEEILQQAEEVYAVASAIDEMDGSMSEVKRNLKKQIKENKDKLKDDLRDQAADQCSDALLALSAKFPEVKQPSLQISDRLDKAMYRRSSLDSIKVALNAVVADVSAEVEKFAEMYSVNKDLLDGIDPEFMPAFQDVGNLMAMATDVLTVEIAKRIEMQKRLNAEAEAREAQEKREQEERDAERAKQAAESSEKPQDPAQEQETPPPAGTVSAPTQKAQPAASQSALEDIEMLVLVRVRGPVEAGRRVRDTIAGAVASEFSVVGEPFLTSPTKLKERYLNDE